MKHIGIVGSRRRNNWTDEALVEGVFDLIYQEGDVIVSGGCKKGADKFAENIARERRIPIRIFHADWRRFGRIAGFLRNTDIAEVADVLIACVTQDRTGGTEDTIRKFAKAHPGGQIFLV